VKKYYAQLIMGRNRGIVAGILRLFLSFASVLYGIGQRLHRFMYMIGLLQRVRLPCPVISIGNLTAGGTGKTPMVEAIAHWLEEHGAKVAILSRGYGKTKSGSDDERLSSASPNIQRFTHPNRARLAQQVLREFKPDVILLDDGFQHYRLHRDLDIVLIDALNPFSNGRLLPRGLLREKPAAAKRADLIVLTRADLVDPDRLETLRTLLGRHAPGRPVLQAVHQAVDIESVTEHRKLPQQWLRGRDVIGVCAIGNPEAFKLTLQKMGASVAHFVAYPDHHVYEAQDYRHINVIAKEFMAEAIVTTQKDATKLVPEDIELPMLVVNVELKFTRGFETLEERLRALIGRPQPVLSKTSV
jgi:tetraacyldisaccharide 4'-kinase